MTYICNKLYDNHMFGTYNLHMSFKTYNLNVMWHFQLCMWKGDIGVAQQVEVYIAKENKINNENKIILHHQNSKIYNIIDGCGSWIYNYLCKQCLSPLTQ